jgi:hypothetical protein
MGLLTRLAAVLALAWFAAAGARACPPPPPLEPAIEAPADEPATLAGRRHAIKAERAWAAPRLKYGVCRRAEINAFAAKANALAEQINAIVEEAAPLERMVRNARGARDRAFAAYAQRRRVKADDLPIAARIVPAPASPPCAPMPAFTAAPPFPDGSDASSGRMRRADEALQQWAAPLESYLACRRSEREALTTTYQMAKAQYDAAQADYGAYRARFNAAVAQFESSIATYTARIADEE